MKFMRFYAIMAFVILAAGASHAQDMPKTALLMAGGSCAIDSSLCSANYSSKSEIIEEANACIKKRFSIDKSIINEFKTGGNDENCAFSTEPDEQRPGFKVWAKCCIVKNDTQDTCKLKCERYLSQQ